MHISSQQKRLLTAAVGLPVVACAVVVGGWPLTALVAAASVVGLLEFFTLAGRPASWLGVTGCILGVLIVGSAAYGGWGAVVALLLAALWIEQFDFLRRFAARGETAPPRGLLVAGLLYVPVALRLLCLFSTLETVFVLAVVMAADTGAYFGGMHVGGPKVWPAVSPKKTWAGCVSGLAAGAVIGVALGLFTAPGAAVLAAVGAVLALISQWGDFYESALKRAAGIKDSGSLLPGHGGMLDRIDGLLPAILAYAAFRPLLGLV